MAGSYFEALGLQLERSEAAARYYELLRRRGLPLPAPHETLREHWRRIRGLLGEDAAGELWEAMLEAERDLYAQRGEDPSP